jgi:ABC-type lipoprotein export system ATPase subunit
MFKILKIRIKGFHSSQKIIEYEFSSENVTIIYGENGCGKTTLLQILNALFSKDDAILFNHKVSEVRMEVSQDNIQKQICIKECKKDVIAVEEGSERRIMRKMYDYSYDWSEFDSLVEQRTLLLGVDRINVQASVSPSVIFNYINSSAMGRQVFLQKGMAVKKAFADNLAEYINYSRKGRLRRNNIDFENAHIVLSGSNVDISDMEDTIIINYRRAVHGASTNIQSALFATLSQVIESKKIRNENVEILEKDLCECYPLILVAIEEIPEGTDNEILNLIKKSSCEEIIEKSRENSYLCLLLLNILQRIKEDIVKYRSILLLRDFFNEYTREDKIMKISREGVDIEIFDQGKFVTKHGLGELSSGEKQLLTLLTCLFIDGKNRNIVLIDEPELSLNMKWQNKLIDLFEEYLPSTQVIMATHSPSIADGHTNCLRKLV